MRWIELLVPGLLFGAWCILFCGLDAGTCLKQGIFPYDSQVYKAIAEQVTAGQRFPPLQAPFNERILFPTLCRIVFDLTGIRLISAFFAVNIAASLGTALLMIRLLSRLKVGQATQWSCLCAFLMFWGGPLRWSIANPGFSTSFDVFLISLMSYLLYDRTAKRPASIGSTIALLLVFFAGGLQRGPVAIGIALVPIAVDLFDHILLRRIGLTATLKKIRPLYLCLAAAALIGTLCVKSITTPTGGYSALRTVVHYGLRNLRPHEFLYPLYYTLGPFLLLIFSMPVWRRTRTEYRQRLQAHAGESLKYIIGFALLGIFFSMVGGTDSDRFILWFFPWFTALAAVALEMLLKRRAFFTLGLLAVVTILWSRPFVPGMPPMVFSNQLNGIGVVTNFDDRLYRGLPYVKRFRNDLVWAELPAPADSVEAPLTVKARVYPEALPDRDETGRTSGHQYEINNLPIPLGYLHNQRDVLVDHPYHGKGWVRYTLLAQWLGCQLLLMLHTRKYKTLG